MQTGTALAPRHGNRRFAIALGCLALAAFAYRAAGLTDTSLWLDEILQVRVTRLPLAEVWGATHYERIPLDYYLQALALRFGENEFTVRLHAAILGALTVAAGGWWGRLAGGFRQGIATAMLWFALPIAVRFSREGSQYALILFAESYLLAALWGVVRRGARTRTRDWVHVAVGVALVFWSSMLAWIAGALAGGAVALLMAARAVRAPAHCRRSRWLPLAGLLGAALAGGILAVPVFWRYLHSPPPGFYAGYEGFAWWRVRMHWDVFALGYDWTRYAKEASWGIAVAALFAIGGAALRPGRRAIALFCTTLGAGVYAAITYSLARANHWTEVRYLLPALPFVVQLAAGGMVSLGDAVARFGSRAKRSPRRAMVATLGAACAIMVAGVLYNARHAIPRSDWRGAARYLAAAPSSRGDILVIDNLDAAALGYYIGRHGLPGPLIDVHQSEERLIAEAEARPGCWIVHREVWPGEPLASSLSQFPDACPPLEFLHIRRAAPWSGTIESAATDGRIPTLGNTARSLEIVAGNETPMRGRGWLMAERWGETAVQAMQADGGRVGIVLDRPADLIVRTRAFPYALDREPPLGLELLVGGASIGIVPAKPDWQEYEYRIPAAATRAGGNVLHFRPTRAVAPKVVDAASTDDRPLSFWFERTFIAIDE